MLIVLIHNDGTGDGIIGSYNVEVRINEKTLARFPVKNHTRALGWSVLLERVAREAWLNQVRHEDRLLAKSMSTVRKHEIRRITKKKKVPMGR